MTAVPPPHRPPPPTSRARRPALDDDASGGPVASAALVLRVALAAQLAVIAIGRLAAYAPLDAATAAERLGLVDWLVFHLGLVEFIGALLLASGSWVRPCAALSVVDLGLAALLSATPAAVLATAVALASALLGAGAWALRLEDSRPADGDGGPHWGTWL